jgi:hypothetical protein
VFELARLRRDRNELIGELTVFCSVPGAQTIDGVLSSGDFNCSAVQTRTTRAKHLAARAQLQDADWEGWLQELVLKVLEAERRGAPAEMLSDVVIDPELVGEFTLSGLTLPRRNPCILFGDGGSAKSYLALWLAGQLATQGECVMYADWEASGQDHRVRQQRLWPASPPPVLYVKCDRPLVVEADRLRRIVQEHGITYAVLDSAAYGCAGAPEAAESCIAYFSALKSVGRIGSLIIAHVNKSEDGDKHPFGSKFWHNSARMTWNAKRSSADDTPGPIDIQCNHRKSNDTKLLPPVYLQVDFSNDRTQISRVHSHTVIADRPEFSRDVSVMDLIKAAIYHRPLTRSEINEAIPEKSADSIQRKVRLGLSKGMLIPFQTPEGKEVISLKAGVR